MKKLKVFLLLTALLALGCASQTQPDDSGQDAAEVRETYFTGNGGSGMRLAVLEPSANGLSEDEQKWMPSTIQSSITGDFNRFSAITVIDRQNLERILAEQTLSLSGIYSEQDYIRIGNLSNASYILAGSVTRTASAYMLELSVTDAESGERKASYPPTQVSPLALENLTAVKAASADLLEQLGVRLTERGRQELGRAPDTAAVQAEMALARGISAQRQGTEVAALSYYFQAAALNPTLLEAGNRASVMSANISSGNIGEDVRNDIAWRRNWVGRLTETEQYFDSLNRTESMPYTLFYSDDIKRGTINYQDETVALGIETNLRPFQTWMRSVEWTLQAVYEGLQATGRTADWGLQGWPRQGVTNLNAFARQNKNFTIEAELLDDRNQIIGRQRFQSGGNWEWTYMGGSKPGIRITGDDKKTVTFTVRAHDISDRLIIRISGVNGMPAETAARNGLLQIRALPKTEYDLNISYDSIWDFTFGEIRGYTGPYDSARDRLGREQLIIPVIPGSIWDEPVSSIGGSVFSAKKLTGGVTIPTSVTSIGESAFANNQLTSVTIPTSVTSIGESAFANNRLTGVTIPTSVTSIGNYAFANNRLANITIPNSVTSIGEGVFFQNQPRVVIIPDSVTSIGAKAFLNPMMQSSYMNISIGANVTLESDSFPFDFAKSYTGRDKRAGVYIWRFEGSSPSGWTGPTKRK